MSADQDVLKKILEYYRTKMAEKIQFYKEVLKLDDETARERAMCFEWHEVGVRPQKLYKLVDEDILEIAYKSRSHTEFKLKIPIEELEILVEGDKTKPERKLRPIEEYFDIIVGYDDVKEIIKMALAAEKPVHICMVGSPATGKTLFLEAIYNSQEDAEFVIGSEASSVGLSKLLRERKPKILLIDEIDKILKSEDLSTLLSVMESGITRRVKGDKITEIEHINVKVFAAANRINRMPEELKSRFLILHFKPYNYEQFMKVCTQYLTRIENAPEDLAKQVAEFTWRFNKDIRTARYIIRLTGSDQEKIKFVMNTLQKYQAPIS